MQAKDLHKQDVTGKADPFVELSTRVQQVEKTVSYQFKSSSPSCSCGRDSACRLAL